MRFNQETRSKSGSKLASAERLRSRQARAIKASLKFSSPDEACCTVRPHLYKSSVSASALPSYPSWSNCAQVFKLDAGADTVG